LTLRYTKALDAIKALRKERVADLKLDKERLEMALREKNHADKLKKRLADMNATIAAKDTEYHELREKAEALAVQNKDFYERATKFRDIYRLYEAAQARKQQLEGDRRDISDSLDVIEGGPEACNSIGLTFTQGPITSWTNVAGILSSTLDCNVLSVTDVRVI
jgi:DNA repair protein RAD50